MNMDIDGTVTIQSSSPDVVVTPLDADSTVTIKGESPDVVVMPLEV